MANKSMCPVCKFSKFEKIQISKTYKLAKCNKCEMVWEHKHPQKLLDQYNKDYFVNENPKGGYANYFESMSINRKTFRDRLNKIESKTGNKGKLLDVGCALGDFLEEAKRLGWKSAEGIEVSDYGYNHCIKKGLKVRKGTLETSNYKSNSFDVVTYQDVIEHITNPVEELRKVNKILKPGGIIYLVTPDIGGVWSKILGPLWYHYKPGEHVVYFSQKTISLALKKAGFIDIKSSRTYHVLTLEYILNRLKYYSRIFSLAHRIIKNSPFKNITFRSYTGELEAW